MLENFSFLYLLRVAYVIVVHFVLSLHNGWIDPRLRHYEQVRAARGAIRTDQLNAIQERERQAQQDNQAQEQPNIQENDVAQEALPEQQEQANEPDIIDFANIEPDIPREEQPKPKIEEEADLFDIIDNDFLAEDESKEPVKDHGEPPILRPADSSAAAGDAKERADAFETADLGPKMERQDTSEQPPDKT